MRDLSNMSASFSIDGTVFQAPSLEAGLYLVATPIGNLGDITIRALQVLASCAVIACEDTRTSGVLLGRYGITTEKMSYNEHNADQRGPDLLQRIDAGDAVALISDAGTPVVSDPGQRLVNEAIERALPVMPIPGASAPTNALIASGLPADNFRFGGFLPAKAQARSKRLQDLSDDPATILFFESPARIVATLHAAIETHGPDRQACVARELTKMHETFHRGRLTDLATEFAEMDRVRGEIVFLVGPATPQTFDDNSVDDMLKIALETMKTKAAAAHVAEQTGLAKQWLYQRALGLQGR